MTPTQDHWAELLRLSLTAATARDFWSSFADVLRRDLAAAHLVIMHRGDAQPDWRPIASAIEAAAARQLGGAEFVKEVGALAALATTPETAPDFPLPRQYRGGPLSSVLGAAVPTTSTTAQAAILALLPASAEFDADVAQARLSAAALLPSIMEARQSSRQAEADAEKLDGVLRLVISAHGSERFAAAAQSLCNAVATLHRCDRVSLGWQEGGYAVLKSVSRQEQFDRKMELARKLEAAMDECLDQGEIITFPESGSGECVTRDHAAFAASFSDGSPPHLVTIPLVEDSKPVAALLAERSSAPFSDAERSGLRLACEQVAPRLIELHRQDRWFGARAAGWARRSLKPLFGPEHTLAKLSAVLVAAALGVITFWKTEYRIEGDFLLRSDRLSNLCAPFDGYIKEVLVESGDPVSRGEVLLRLDTEALRVEETSAEAEMERYDREAEKARAAKKVADMKIAQTLAQQAKARLDVIRYRLAQAEVRSTIDGVVVEGDLKERLDAPVKQGDGLFRVARLSDFFIDIKIDERDAHEIADGAMGEAAFIADPARKLPIKVVVVLPSAVEKDGAEVFAARARFEGGAEPWWRPGLSGVAKINAGKRTLLWILTHRTVDFLRMKLWW
jgi:biotin carboxyl carrier protein